MKLKGQQDNLQRIETCSRDALYYIEQFRKFNTSYKEMDLDDFSPEIIKKVTDARNGYKDLKDKEIEKLQTLISKF